jgi:hypothetical protein
MKILYRLALLALLCPCLPAAELVVRDGFFAIELLPTDFSYDFSSDTLSDSGSDGFESHYGIAAGVRYSFAGPGDEHGFLVGGAIEASQAAYQSIGHLTSFGLRVDGGYGYAINDKWLLSGLIGIGYGVSAFDLTANSVIPAVSTSGNFLQYGARLEIDYAFTNLFHMGLAAGWRHYGHDLSGSGLSMTVDNDGAVIAIGISYRLSNSPSPLE